MTKPHHDIVVVGRGFAGLTSAFKLANAGFDVGVVSCNQDKAMASSAAQGISTLKGLNTANQELFLLKMAGHRGFLKWVQEIETKAGANIQKILGVQEFFLDLPKFSHEQSRIFKNAFNGVFNVKKSEKTSDYPSFLTKDKFYSQYYPADFWINPDQYLEALFIACKNVGVQFYDNLNIVNITETDALCEIKTDLSIKFCSKKVVLCAGVGVGKIKINQDLGEKLYAAPGNTLKQSIEFKDKNICAVKELAGAAIYEKNLFLGSTTETNGVTVQGDTAEKLIQTKSPFSEVKQHFEMLWNKVFGSSELIDFQEDSVRWGVRVRTKSRVPVIKYISEKNKVILNTGYYKSGLTLTYLGADQVLNLVKKEPL